MLLRLAVERLSERRGKEYNVTESRSISEKSLLILQFLLPRVTAY